jgi:hypothetical protein
MRFGALFLLAICGCRVDGPEVLVHVGGDAVAAAAEIEATFHLSGRDQAPMHLWYAPAGGFSLDKDGGTSFVVLLGEEDRGLLDVEVEARDAHGCALGRGQAEIDLTDNRKRDLSVLLVDVPDGCARDAGVPDDLASPVDANPCPATVPPDGGRLDAAGRCNIAPNLGCPCGAACDLDSTHLDGGTACREVVALGHETAACNTYGNAECDRDYTCVSFSTFGCSDCSTCMRYCRSNGDCVAPGGRCQNLFFANNIPNLRACSPNCSPVQPSTGCPAGWTCRVDTIPDAGAAGSSTICIPAGTLGNGASCTSAAQCATGYECLSPGGCRKYCDYGRQMGCPTGLTCVSSNPRLILVDGTEYGFCL